MGLRGGVCGSVTRLLAMGGEWFWDWFWFGPWVIVSVGHGFGLGWSSRGLVWVMGLRAQPLGLVKARF